MQNLSKPSLKDIKIVLITLVILLIIGWIYIYNNTDYVIIRFNELGPISKNMTAYYKGFRIGKIVRIEPDKDFKHTLVKVRLNRKNIQIPQNSTAYVEKLPNGEMFLQFIYPGSPSLKTIQRGDILEGIAPSSIEQFMLGQTISGVTDLVSIHVIKALDAMDVANKQMEVFFNTTSKILQENDKAIKESVDNTKAMTKSLAQMAENLNQASKKLNNALDEKSLKNTASNIEDATYNLSKTTVNVAKATENFDETIKKIDETITQANATAENLNMMTSGINETLNKRFAGMRIIFGKAVNQKNTVRHACK